MDQRRIAELLHPFLAARAINNGVAALSETQLQQISVYLDLLLRWNARVNLTAVRDPENIVTRHFGESLFAARCLPACNNPTTTPGHEGSSRGDLIDFGAGAGFPGLPIKIWVPELRVTLIESNHKKATFLREVCRSLALTNVDVYSGRAEKYGGPLGDIVILRAVERFEASLSEAVRLVASGGRIALLVGEQQVAQAKNLQIGFDWRDPIPLPLSQNRVLLMGRRT